METIGGIIACIIVLGTFGLPFWLPWAIVLKLLLQGRSRTNRGPHSTNRGN